MVNLPDITKVPVGDQPSDIEAPVRTMILSYIKHKTWIILAVPPANTIRCLADSSNCWPWWLVSSWCRQPQWRGKGTHSHWRLFPAFHNCEGKGGCIGEDLCWSCCTSVKKTFSHSMQAEPMRITRCWSIHWMGVSFCGDQHGLLAVILKWANCKLCTEAFWVQCWCMLLWTFLQDIATNTSIHEALVYEENFFRSWPVRDVFLPRSRLCMEWVFFYLKVA